MAYIGPWVCISLFLWDPMRFAVAEISTHERNVEKEKATIKLAKHLFHDYHKEIRPFYGTNRPVEVNIAMGIVSFEDISETNRDFTLNVYLIEQWIDPRLRYNSSLTLPPSSLYIPKLWLPDLIFLNAKQADLHTITLDNRVSEILPDGKVVLIQRIRLVVACSMDFIHFPMDEQQCHIDMESFEYSTKYLVFQFNSETTPPVFFFGDHSKVPQFTIRGANLQNCSKGLQLGTISCIRLTFLFKRKAGFYIIHAYIPSFMLVALSWISFWIDIRCAPARIALGITTILSMLTISNGVRQDLPKLAYLKSIDIWFMVTYAYVIAALLEYAFVHYIAIQKPDTKYLKNVKSKKRESSDKINEESKNPQIATKSNTGEKSTDDAAVHRRGKVCDKYDVAQPELAEIVDIELPEFRYGLGQRIDYMSRILFPLSFTLFIIIYIGIATPRLEDPQLNIKDLDKISSVFY